MTGGFASRRRADEFDALLSGSDSRSVEDARVQELLDLVGAMRAVPEPPARPAFVADLRSRLVAAAEAQPVRKVDEATFARLTPTQRRGRSERRLATVLGGFAVVAATGSMAMASQSALPGDTLYPVKRAIENARTNLQSSDAGKAQSLLDNAARRLDEIKALNERGDGSSDEIAATLQDFTDETNQATSHALADYDQSGDQNALQDVRNFADSSMDQLTQIGDSVPKDVRPALITAAQTVRQADDAASQACPTCSGDPITELPDFATRALTELLLPRAAERVSADTDATAPAGGGKARHHKPARHQTTTAAGTDDPTAEPTTPTLPTPTVPPADDDPIKTTLGDVLGSNNNSGGGDGSGSNDGNGSLTGSLVDGVNGLLGGLLK
ncbi:DUF5667 domain-containing protein [Nocardioides panacisoli]|uniref:DUF5667 domain-containing protein n=1 Tax=Nocardioides panacisoli TaxID=627624 RepID=A0ABP7IDA3_9ACTN